MNDEQQPGAERSPDSRARRSFAQQIEEQLRKVRVQDLLLESVVSVINLSARRIAKEDERDLEQARVGIEAVRAVVDLLDDEPAKQVRSALSEVQVLYAKHAGGGAGEPEGGGEAPPPGGEAPPRRGRAARALEALDAAREHAAPLDSARFAAGVPSRGRATRKPTGGLRLDRLPDRLRRGDRARLRRRRGRLRRRSSRSGCSRARPATSGCRRSRAPCRRAPRPT